MHNYFEISDFILQTGEMFECQFIFIEVSNRTADRAQD